MTASRNKASRAVTAALVGVLSVGAVPMVAVAAESGSGAVTLATDAANIAGADVEYATSGQVLVPTSVTLVGGTVVDDLEFCPSSTDDREKDDWYYFYVDLSEKTDLNYDVKYVDEDGNEKSLSKGKVMTVNNGMPTEIGEYVVVVGQWGGTNWTGLVSKGEYFQIEGESLDSATLYQVNPSDATDLSDTTISYTGVTNCRDVSAVEEIIGVAVDGKALERYDEGKKTGDYSVEIYAVGASEALGDEAKLNCDTRYVAVITGHNAYVGQTKSINFTYGKLDLSEAVVVTKTVVTEAPSADSDVEEIVASINGVDKNNILFERDVELEYVSGPDGSGTASDKKGTYTFTLKAVKDSPYVTGEQTITVTYADIAAHVMYKGSELESSYDVNLSDEDPDHFVLGAISVTYTDDDEKKTVPSSGYTVTVTDADGNEVTDLTQPGTYTITVDVDYSFNDDEGTKRTVAGSKTCTVIVSYGTVTQEENVYLTFDGENVVSSVDPTYDGTDQLDKVAVKVVAGSKTLVEGTDYSVTVTNEDGDEVDEAVNAGTYTVTVKGLTYEGTATFTIVVDKLALVSLVPTSPFAAEDTYNANGKVIATKYFLNYTGEELEPEYVFYDAEGNEWTLDSDEYEVTYVDEDKNEVELRGEGTYSVRTVKVDADNFKAGDDGVSLPNELDTIEVTANRVFADVPNDEWYTSAVATAKEQGYVYGMGGSNLFMPNRSISRADMVVIIYRMAGGVTSEDWHASETEMAYLAQYDDVDATAYYARALAWATRTGVVSGYEDGSFGPDDDVTVEQFVTMLGRYAKVVGDYEAPEDVDATLATKDDGQQVSEFAEEYVAWALESDYIGRDGADIQPVSDISRARAITIAVRYQPKKADLV